MKTKFMFSGTFEGEVELENLEGLDSEEMKEMAWTLVMSKLTDYVEDMRMEKVDS